MIGQADAATGNLQQVCEIAVGAHFGGDDGALAGFGAAQDGGSGTIAEEHAGRAILPIGDGGEFFRADDEGVLESAVGDQALGDFHRIEKPGAGGGNIERHGVGRAELLLDMAGGRRSRRVRRDGGDDDQFDFLGGEAGLFERVFRGLGRHVRGELIVRGDPALPDAGAGDDPLVAGIHSRGELFVG